MNKGSPRAQKSTLQKPGEHGKNQSAPPPKPRRPITDLAYEKQNKKKKNSDQAIPTPSVWALVIVDQQGKPAPTKLTNFDDAVLEARIN